MKRTDTLRYTPGPWPYCNLGPIIVCVLPDSALGSILTCGFSPILRTSTLKIG